MTTHLNLSKDQQAKVMTLRENMWSASEIIRDQITALRDKIHAEWTSSNPDENTIIELKQQILTQRGKMQVLRTEFKMDVLNLLNDQQKEQFRANINKRRQNRANRNNNKNRYNSHNFSCEQSW